MEGGVTIIDNPVLRLKLDYCQKNKHILRRQIDIKFYPTFLYAFKW